MSQLIFHPDVSHEIKAAYQWYENQANGLGDDFLTELESSFGLIISKPKTWPPFSGNTRRFLLRRFPFSVIYSELDRKVLVLAVMHDRKKPGYWEERGK